MILLRLAVVLLLGWPGMPRAQVPLALAKPAAAAAAPAAPVLSPAQAQAVLGVLQDEAKRTQFITVLQNIAKVQTATGTPASQSPLSPGSLGAELLTSASGILGRASAEMLKTLRTLVQLPHLVSWLGRAGNNPANRTLVIDFAWKLALLAALAGGGFWLTARLLTRWRTSLRNAGPRLIEAEPSHPIALDDAELDQSRLEPERTDPRRRKPSSWGLLQRLPFSALLLLADLAPIVVAAVIAYATLATPLGATPQTRLALLGVLNAALLFATVLAFVRMVLSPVSAGLRLVHLSDVSAAYLTRWSARLAFIVLSGVTINQLGLLFRMDATVRETLIKLVALAVHVCALIIVLQCRPKVSRRIRAPRGARGAWAVLRNRIAELWHVAAIFYIVALWLIFALEIRNGYAIVWRYFVAATIVLAAARLTAIVLLGALDRTLDQSSDTLPSYGLLTARAGRYHGALRVIVNGLIAIVSIAVLLQLWGVPIHLLLRGGTLGNRIAHALGASLLVVALAVAAWEAINAAIEAHLATLASQAQLARSARLRTLLPMLRTALMIVIATVVALMVLNEIGLNTAPLLAGAGVIGIAVGFGSQKLVQDVITGLFLLLENAMQVGDWVTLGGLSGTVENLSIRTIRLRALDGAVHVIPFSAVTTVTNATRDYGYAVLDVTAGYNEEPDTIAAVLREVYDQLRADPAWAEACEGEIDIQGVDRFLDNAWVLRARVKTPPSKRLPVQRELNRRLKYRFDESAIESPFTSPRILSTVPGPPPDVVAEPAHPA